MIRFGQIRTDNIMYHQLRIFLSRIRPKIYYFSNYRTCQSWIEAFYAPGWLNISGLCSFHSPNAYTKSSAEISLVKYIFFFCRAKIVFFIISSMLLVINCQLMSTYSSEFLSMNSCRVYSYGSLIRIYLVPCVYI